ncbi:MAG: Stp1/IreP family PP2C-type Ser/Thr phosphatase [Coriobacteriia bacterium]|nr:Stp1/IreP family PP2C-type Ser/Thr phosphatase [Coriobacteriia bacterium]
MTARAKQTWAALTDVGRVRSHNEDAIMTDPPLFAVADGLGGHEAGEVASQIAIETLRDHAPRKPDANALARAVRAANAEVIRAAREGVGRSGMGTTITAAIVDGTQIVIAQVGDSRAYLLRQGHLTRITDDHSMVADLIRSGQLTEEESRVHPNRSVITRALGTDPNMVADTFAVEGEQDDRLLLCSDGLTGMLTDDVIAQMLGDYRDPATAARTLIDAANEAGGQDNVSVVVVDIGGAGSSGRGFRSGEKRLRQWVAVLAWVLLAALIAAAIAGATYAYARSRAYVVVEDRAVVIYRGVEGEVAGLSLHWKDGSQPIALDRLTPAQKAQLARGMTFDGVEAARAYVRSLETSSAP